MGLVKQQTANVMYWLTSWQMRLKQHIPVRRYGPKQDICGHGLSQVCGQDALELQMSYKKSNGVRAAYIQGKTPRTAPPDAPVVC